MRIGILARNDGYYFCDLARAAKGDTVVPLNFSDLACDIDGTELKVTCGEVQLASFDAVIVRTMPPGTLEQVVYRMDLLAALEDRGIAIVNPPKSLEAAVDKFLTSARLQLHRIPTPRTIACQTWESALAAFESLGGKVVVKPLFGGEGRGIFLVTDSEMALRVFKMLTQLGAVLYLQEFVEHAGEDIRILIIGDDAFAVKRINPSDWRTNSSRGARTVSYQASAHQVQLARQAAKVVGAPIAGVDIVTSPVGQDLVIEVNAVPGWKATASALKIDIASQVIQWIRQTIRR